MFASHLPNGFDAEQIKTLGHDHGRRFAQQKSTRIDFHYFTRFPVLLNAIAGVVELRERRRQVVEIVADVVGIEFVRRSSDDFRELDYAFAQLQLLGMIQTDRNTSGFLSQRLPIDLSQTIDGTRKQDVESTDRNSKSHT